MRLRMLIAVCAMTILATASLAAVPTSITVQGKLTDASGAPLTAGNKELTFRVFDQSIGGSVIWPGGAGEIQTVTTGADGLWVVLLGSSLPLTDAVFADTVRWLEITVDDLVNPETTLPRIRLVTGPYAYRVATVDGASGGTITSKLSIGPGHTNSGIDAFVAGAANVANGDYSTVGGGYYHTASGYAAAIGGGFNNTASGNYATVGGGQYNGASSIAATVGGGVSNTAGSTYATVPGGFENVASGSSSFAAGARAKALHSGTFVWSAGPTFSSTGANQFLINASGGVGIGTNSPYTNTGGQVLHIDNASGASVLRLGDGAENGIQWEVQSTTISGSGALNFSNVSMGLNPLTILDFGNIGIGVTNPDRILKVVQNSATDPQADAWTTYSSRRWKEDIAPIKDALDKVNRLQGVTYKWKADGKHDIGLIAEEVGEVIPEIVQYEENGVDAQSLDYSRLVAVLIEAMKEQQRQIDNLKARLDRQTP